MSNITGGFMFPTFGFGEIGCINNYFLLKGDDFDDSKCDYVICAKCDLTSLFPNPDATDNVDGSDGDSIGFVVPSVDVVCDCLKESMVELRYTEGVNDDIVDMQRSAEDRYSWRDGNANSAGAPKCWDLDDAASDAPPDSDFALVENQHFTFPQNNGSKGAPDEDCNHIYAVPRGGLLDKVVRIYLHCSSGQTLSMASIPAYHHVTKLIGESICEYQNKEAVFDTSKYTDIYHEQIAQRVFDSLSANNEDFRAKILSYVNNINSTGGSLDPTNVDLSGFQIYFCFEYRYKVYKQGSSDASDLMAADPSYINNTCPEFDGFNNQTNFPNDPETAGENGKTLMCVEESKTVCLKLTHESV